MLLCQLCGQVYGQLNVSTITDQEKAKVEIEISIYPNPATEYFTLNSQSSVQKLTIHNIIGKEVKTFEVNDDNRYNVSALKKGIYVIRIFDQDDQLIKALRLSKS